MILKDTSSHAKNPEEKQHVFFINLVCVRAITREIVQV